MQDYQNKLKTSYFFPFFLSLIFSFQHSIAQVSTVEFGQNRIQFKKFKWQYY